MFNMYYRFYIIVFLLVSFFTNSANDSLKIKRYKVELNSGLGRFVGGAPLDKHWYNETFSFSNILSGELTFSYQILQQSSKKQFLDLGLGLKYSRVSVIHIKPDFGDGGNSYWSEYDFQQEEFSYIIEPVSVSLFVGKLNFFNNLFIYQRLGVNYTDYLNKEIISYSVHETGWYIKDNKRIDYSWMSEQEEKNYFKPNFNPFYNLNFGYKIKNVLPYLGLEFSYFKGIPGCGQIRALAGIAIVF